MMRRLLPSLLLAAAFLLDTVIVPQFTTFWLVPIISLLLIHCFGLLLGRTRGLLLGMIAGLALDISVSTPLGLMTLIGAALGYAGGWFGRLMWRSRLSPLISSVICFTLYELAMDEYVMLMSAQLESGLILRSLGRVPVYVLLVWGAHIWLKRVLRPGNPYYTR